jgi:hypothetical protein
MNEQLNPPPELLYRKRKDKHELIGVVEKSLTRAHSELVDARSEIIELDHQSQSEESEDMQRALRRGVRARKTDDALRAIRPDVRDAYDAASTEAKDHYEANEGAYQEQALKEARESDKEIVGWE